MCIAKEFCFAQFVNYERIMEKYPETEIESGFGVDEYKFPDGSKMTTYGDMPSQAYDSEGKKIKL